MANRVKPDAYDWSQISQQAADRARADKEICKNKSLETIAAKDKVEEIKNAALKLLNDAQSSWSTKVDKEPDKGLSTTDYTGKDKAKINGLKALDTFVDLERILV